MATNNYGNSNQDDQANQQWNDNLETPKNTSDQNLNATGTDRASNDNSENSTAQSMDEHTKRGWNTDDLSIDREEDESFDETDERNKNRQDHESDRNENL